MLKLIRLIIKNRLNEIFDELPGKLLGIHHVLFVRKGSEHTVKRPRRKQR